MLDDPGLNPMQLAGALRTAFGVEGSTFGFLPSHDLDAASYEVTAADGAHFLKVRFGPVPTAPLAVPRALLDAGVPNVLAPILTRDATLSAAWEDRSLTLYPFVRGRNAMVAGMTDDGWRTFGATLRAVHDSGLERQFSDILPVETFSLPAAGAVRRMLVMADHPAVRSAAAGRFARFCREQAGRIGEMTSRAQELGWRLRGRSLPQVLCHADIHAANILVADDGRILLVDWDGPMLAPRERDLLFVIGSRIARRVEPHEEARFFEGYGELEVDPDAIVYFRYERILEDIAVDGASIFGDPALTDATREAQVDLIASFFAPGGIVENVEEV